MKLKEPGVSGAGILKTKNKHIQTIKYYRNGKSKTEIFLSR